MASQIIPEFVEFDITGPDPSGSRTDDSASAFLGHPTTESGNFLDFGTIVLGALNSGISTTHVMVFRPDAITGAIDNMRFWMTDSGDFIGLNDNFKFLARFSGDFLVDSGMSPFADNEVPSTLPTTQNLFRGDGGTQLSDSDEINISEYIYLSIFASGTAAIPEGEYGGNTGGFTFRVTYDLE